jgi:hypothetical protein
MNAIQLLSKRILEAARRRPVSQVPFRPGRERHTALSGERLARAG